MTDNAAEQEPRLTDEQQREMGRMLAENYFRSVIRLPSHPVPRQEAVFRAFVPGDGTHPANWPELWDGEWKK